MNMKWATITLTIKRWAKVIRVWATHCANAMCECVCLSFYIFFFCDKINDQIRRCVFAWKWLFRIKYINVISLTESCLTFVLFVLFALVCVCVSVVACSTLPLFILRYFCWRSLSFIQLRFFWLIFYIKFVCVCFFGFIFVWKYSHTNTHTNPDKKRT